MPATRTMSLKSPWGVFPITGWAAILDTVHNEEIAPAFSLLIVDQYIHSTLLEHLDFGTSIQGSGLITLSPDIPLDTFQLPPD